MRRYGQISASAHIERRSRRGSREMRDVTGQLRRANSEERARRPRLLIVNGLPAAGKTTLAHGVVPRLGLPLYSKDAIKESLFDTLGWSDRSWSRRLGGAAWELLWLIAETSLRAGQSLAIESNFTKPVAEERLAAWRGEFDFRAIELRCVADREVLIARFMTRAESDERHPGHVERDAGLLRDDFIPTLRAADDSPLALTDGTLTIDTTDFGSIDLASVVLRTHALLWPEEEEAIERHCDACGKLISEPYAHCAICQADYCLACGATHLCNATCVANGCIPGRCVRVVINGELSPKWGVPAELL